MTCTSPLIVQNLSSSNYLSCVWPPQFVDDFKNVARKKIARVAHSVAAALFVHVQYCAKVLGHPIFAFITQAISNWKLNQLQWNFYMWLSKTLSTTYYFKKRDIANCKFGYNRKCGLLLLPQVYILQCTAHEKLIFFTILSCNSQ